MRRILQTLTRMARWDEPWEIEDGDDDVLAPVTFLPLGAPSR